MRTPTVGSERRRWRQSAFGVPEWMEAGATVTALGLVIGALVIDHGSLPWLVASALGAAALVPWIPGFGVRTHSLLYVVLSLVPVTLLAMTGAAPLVLALLALATTRVAAFERIPVAIVFAVVAQGVIAIRYFTVGEADWFMWKSYVELGLALGWALRGQRLLVLRSEQSVHERSRLAAMEERRRIARDVHDVIAHSLSVTLLHLNSARMLLDEDPAASVEVLDEAVQHGRKSLGEVRQVVGLLSEPSGIEVPGDPTAAAAAVEELVADYRGAGLDVELHLDVAMEHMGLLASTPTGVWGTGYRLIQEALANVVKHSPGMRADIVVQVSDDALLIEITNPLPPGVVPLEHSGGYGLRGMRERAEMLGGRVDVGADTAPCGLMWRVRAELPLDVRRVPQSRWSAFVGGMS